MTTATQAEDRVTTGVLLAGGAARRAGVDKRYLVLGGRTLLQRNLTFLRELFPRVIVSLGRGQTIDLGDAGGAEVVHDAWPGSSPLAGIATVLARLDTPVFVMAADLAAPDRGGAERVLAAFAGYDIALPAIGPEFHQPLFAVYGPACLAPMKALLDAGRHRLVSILPEVRVAEVRFPDESLFHNINTMDEYQAARREAAERADGESAAGGDAAGGA